MTRQRVEQIRDEVDKLLLFSDVEPARVTGLLNDCSIICLAPGDVVLSQGEVNRNCYCILSGSLRIHLDSLENPPVSILHAGESVGEISLLDGQQTSAHVVCDSDCQLLVLEEDTFWSLVNASHSFPAIYCLQVLVAYGTVMFRSVKVLKSSGSISLPPPLTN